VTCNFSSRPPPQRISQQLTIPLSTTHRHEVRPRELSADGSKISVANVRQNIKDLLQYSLDEKKRNFTETIELQIGLKNYDPQRYGRGVLRLIAVTNVSRDRLNCLLFPVRR
jgi:hypothetical protein